MTGRDATGPGAPSPASPVSTAMHWYDLTCPYCYIAQARNAILERAGVRVVDRPFRAHPEIPAGGLAMGPRSGPMYDRLDLEAARSGLPSRWPDRLPNTAVALGMAEWVRVHRGSAFPRFRDSLFATHFALGRDIGDPAVVDDLAAEAGLAPREMRSAVALGEVDALLAASERHGREVGVTGTPTWLIRDRLIVGLQTAEAFERIARAIGSSGSQEDGPRSSRDGRVDRCVEATRTVPGSSS